MRSKITFKSEEKELAYPLFFPDATRGFIKTVDSIDIKNTKTPGILVNTYHLYRDLGEKVFEGTGGVRKFMSWDEAIISDSGGFQVMSLVKNGQIDADIIDKGIRVRLGKKKTLMFTPELSIRIQMQLNTDLVVVLDDFTLPGTTKRKAKISVDRTIEWARRSKEEFERICKKKKLDKDSRPYIIGVVQGGDFLDLRAKCAEELAQTGFDGFGYGGWPLKDTGEFNYEVARLIADHAPDDYILYGLGIGKPEDVVGCVNLGYHIFDCVLPTRDARHRRLYIYNAKSIEKIDITKPDFYSFYTPDKSKYKHDQNPISTACDCLLCTNYSKAYLAYLFKMKEATAKRLSTIHNLRFYSILMEKLKK